ncbi:L-threonylcarbamoyladenylate synthase [Adhaeribacter pallidiroseus]|uniref:Threonylcarbamoyl-AMP synthase n=1 Tax=Adhaeribacter pallidiroseus TaxID=2072847 RepID=A0A369QMZ8_9BACT|nr:L-threonylcarbamoyladenylate synthase [Adhaeribacter pallidiroseus]RDC66291.1 L-threonylcarbamoyladenylate synthase [Adhaeribacter pallidiroseus]
MAVIGTDIEQAATLLRTGKLVAIPTETVYGLAASAFQEPAVISIFEAKQRPAFDPLIVHTHSINQFEQIAVHIPDLAYKLAEAFMPGPVTLILPRNPQIPLLVTSGNESVGVRIPDHPLTLSLLQQLDFPVAAPSANPFGYVSPTTAQHVAQQLGDRIPYILDGGPCQVGIESTIIQVINDQLEILRLGGLALDQIEAVINKPITYVRTSSSNPKAPGMLSSHYAPRKKVILGNIPENLKKYEPQSLGILSFRNLYEPVPTAQQFVLSPSGDTSEAARNLFLALRYLDALPIAVILAELVPETGLGKAINDRLTRASF